MSCCNIVDRGVLIVGTTLKELYDDFSLLGFVFCESIHYIKITRIFTRIQNVEWGKRRRCEGGGMLKMQKNIRYVESGGYREWVDVGNEGRGCKK